MGEDSHSSQERPFAHPSHVPSSPSKACPHLAPRSPITTCLGVPKQASPRVHDTTPSPAGSRLPTGRADSIDSRPPMRGETDTAYRRLWGW